MIWAVSDSFVNWKILQVSSLFTLNHVSFKGRMHKLKVATLTERISPKERIIG